jgi:microcystin-dependent protein
MPIFVTTRDYQDGTTLTQAELDAAFTSIETFLNTTGLDATNIQNGAIGNNQLAASAVGTSNIAANAITTTLIEDASITRSKISVTEQLPTGVIMEYCVATPPTGWLNADGSLVSRNTYATLFSVIGTTYGAGDGSTTFALPKRSGVVAIGQGTAASGTSYTLGATGGEETHVLSENEMPSHTHTVTPEISFNSQGFTNGGSGPPPNTSNTSMNTGATGGGAAHNNMQPYLVQNFIIKY